MCLCVVRYAVGLMMYAAGLFWAPLVVLGLIFSCLKRGPCGFLGLFLRRRYSQLPEVAKSSKYRHDFVTTKSGMRFHYVHTGATDAPLMLCLHGFPECWYSYHHVLDHFADRYHVVAIDMRGYGHSQKPRSTGSYHKDYLLQDVRQIVTALGYRKTTIVGNGPGGFVGWELPYYYPDLVERLIIMNAPDKKGFREYLCRYPWTFITNWHFYVFQLPWLPEIFFKANDYRVIETLFNGTKYGINNSDHKLSDDELGIYKSNAGKEITYPLNYYRAMNPIHNGMGLRRKDHRIRVPVLIIWGMLDPTLDHRMVPFMEEHCDDVKVQYLEGCSHWVSLDQPDQMLEAMENFLADSS